ncbi:MAG: hypothetical protein JEY94_17480 [Melioribacteraceae bacterium]|nr:hypothetical protein [Melioribacteraceae bacterium]
MEVKSVSVKFLAGQSISEILTLNSQKIIGFRIPNDWDSANLTILNATPEYPDYADVITETASELEVLAVAGKYTKVSPDDFAGFDNIKLRSGISSSPVNQTSERIIEVRVREY